MRCLRQPRARGGHAAALLAALLICAPPPHAALAQGAHSTFAYEALLRQYLAGDATRALESLATWSGSELEQAVARMPLEDEHRIQLDASPAASGQLFAMAALHAEAAVTSGSPELFRLNARLGERAIKLLSRRRGAERFCGTWYLSIAAFAVVLGDVPAAATRLSAAQRVFGNDDRVLVARGALDEMSAGPLRVAPDLAGLSFRQRIDARDRFEPTVLLRDAKAAFLAALRANPANAEARLRLGRVLFLLGDQEESVAQLSECRRVAGTTEVACLCRLFLGLLYEKRQKLEAAEEAFREAAELAPNAVSAKLAVARLLDLSGRTEEAARLIAPALSRERKAGEPPDPWWRYQMNQLTDPGGRLVELRTLARAAAR